MFAKRVAVGTIRPLLTNSTRMKTTPKSRASEVVVEGEPRRFLRFNLKNGVKSSVLIAKLCSFAFWNLILKSFPNRVALFFLYNFLSFLHCIT